MEENMEMEILKPVSETNETTNEGLGNLFYVLIGATVTAGTVGAVKLGKWIKNKVKLKKELEELEEVFREEIDQMTTDEEEAKDTIKKHND